MPANLENSALAMGLDKIRFHSNSKEKQCQRMFKLLQSLSATIQTISLISHASKVMLKILRGTLQQYVNWGLPEVQAGFRKGTSTTYQIANISYIRKKQDNFREKKSTSVALTMLEPLALWITTNYGKFFKWWEYHITLLASWEIRMQVKRQQLVHKDCILSSWLFNLYAEYHEKYQAGWNTSWNKDCQEKYQ